MKLGVFFVILPVVLARVQPDVVNRELKKKRKKRVGADQIGPNYAQLSSTETQENGPLGVGSNIEMDSVDALAGVGFDPTLPTDIVINAEGPYFALAAPQVGGKKVSAPQIADYYGRSNGIDIGNSNVRYASEGEHQDVIITQGVLEFAAGDVFQVAGSGDNSFTQVISQVGEPLVPSIIFSIFRLNSPVFAQLSSGVTQTNGPLGVGTAISYDSVDALQGIGFDPFGESTKIVIQEDGAYFALAAPQVGAADPDSEMPVIADYYMKLNGELIGNSNVRWAAEATEKDVIITQGVLELTAGDELEVFGSGVNALTEAIFEFGEPLVPSIIFSIFKLTDAAPYAQLSSSATQVNGPLGSGVAISFSNIDALSGIGFDPASPTQVVIQEDGAYFAVAAPQIGGAMMLDEQVADYWVKINGEDVGNSSVRYQNSNMNKDVIITQGVLELSAGDIVEVFGSGVNSQTEFIQEAGEPDVPSIIFSLFKV